MANMYQWVYLLVRPSDHFQHLKDFMENKYIIEHAGVFILLKMFSDITVILKADCILLHFGHSSWQFNNEFIMMFTLILILIFIPDLVLIYLFYINFIFNFIFAINFICILFFILILFLILNLFLILILFVFYF